MRKLHCCDESTPNTCCALINCRPSCQLGSMIIGCWRSKAHVPHIITVFITIRPVWHFIGLIMQARRLGLNFGCANTPNPT